jgi:hypothetical protein
MFPALISLLTFSLVNINSIIAVPQTHQVLLSEHVMSLTDRYPVSSVNNIFRDNILLTLAYMNHSTTVSKTPDWQKVRTAMDFSFTLTPGQTFAFDDSGQTEHPNIVKTTTAHFVSDEGFRSDGYLAGDGVCHLASLFNWAGHDAGLDVLAPTNHNFRTIPGIDAKYGTSIYFAPDEERSNSLHNLYITNTKQHPVIFHISANPDNVSVTISEEQEAPILTASFIKL